MWEFVLLDSSLLPCFLCWVTRKARDFRGNSSRGVREIERSTVHTYIHTYTRTMRRFGELTFSILLSLFKIDSCLFLFIFRLLLRLDLWAVLQICLDISHDAMTHQAYRHLLVSG